MTHTNNNGTTRNGFTLAEILVVVGVFAVLVMIVALVLNPVELLKQGRDGKRIEDITTLDSYIQTLLWQQPDAFLGTSSVVYLSIPDTSATCGNTETPSLPGVQEGESVSYTFHCVTEENLRNTDGTGWIPINFGAVPSVSISALPLDPLNKLPTEERADYYVYMTSGKDYHLVSSIESDKYRLGGPRDATSMDGGSNLGLFEKGTNLSLIPYDFGDITLEQYIDFNEGIGIDLIDRSAYSSNLRLFSGVLWASGSSCKKKGCVWFDGVNDYIKETWSGAGRVFSSNEPYSVSVWINWDSAGTNNVVYIGKLDQNLPSFRLRDDTNGTFRFKNVSDQGFDFASSIAYGNVWTHTMWVADGTGNMTFYINGVKQSTQNVDDSQVTVSALGGKAATSKYYKGYMDELRVFSRALSDQEVLSLYNYEK